jgi:hypothetical protein
MLTANLFSQFVSDPGQVARMVNTMSALSGHHHHVPVLDHHPPHPPLIVKDWDSLTPGKTIAIMGSRMVGVLIYTSPTPSGSRPRRVRSMLFVGLHGHRVLAHLKWEDHADEPHADRWLVLIFYMTGLSIGVHLLNLLFCRPSCWCTATAGSPTRSQGSLVALLVSFVIVAAVLYGVVRASSP